MSLAFIVISHNRTQNYATDRQTEFGQTEGQKNKPTDEIIYVRFCRYVWVSFANFLLRKKYVAQIKNIRVYMYILILPPVLLIGLKISFDEWESILLNLTQTTRHL